MITLGSLFDGSGACPLAATVCGITPIWASEIEKYPIAVTSARFPSMKHLGDITKINGAEIAPVDIITFGSPCQDLSVAGKQNGLKGSRSSLFFEAIRIIHEMREATDGVYPRIAIWENVPGAFTSNKGEDFRAVLQAFAAEAGHTEPVPRPEKGKWACAGRILGDGFSIAYRTLDAQYWGVPQRRRRIFLVADFRGECAGEILFKREGLCGNFTQGGAAREETAEDAHGGAGGSVEPGIFHSLTATNARCAESAQSPNCVAYPTISGGSAGIILNDQGGDCMSISEDITATLRAQEHGHQPIVAYDTTQITSPDNRSNPEPGDPCHTLQAEQHAPLVIALQQGNTNRNGAGWNDEAAYTLNTIDRHAVAIDCRNMAANETRGTLQAKNEGGYSLNYQNPVCYAADGFSGYSEGMAAALRASGGNHGGGSESLICMAHGQANAEITEDICATLNCNHEQPIIAKPAKPPRRCIVRRLTPTECARLQGFSAWWGNIIKESFAPGEEEFWRRIYDEAREKAGRKPARTPIKTEKLLKWYNGLSSDSSEYRMWGNGMAFPCILYVMEGAAEVLRRAET